MNGILCVICGNRRLLTINGWLVCFVFFLVNLSMSSFVTRFLSFYLRFASFGCPFLSFERCERWRRPLPHVIILTPLYLRIILPSESHRTKRLVCTCVVGATHTHTRATKISHKIVKNKHNAAISSCLFYSFTFNLFVERDFVCVCIKWSCARARSSAIERNLKMLNWSIVN